MAFPPELQIPTRRTLADWHKRFRQTANPAIDLAEGGEPDIAANVMADMLLPSVAYARRVGRAAFVTSATGEDIGFWGDVEGVPPPEPTGSLGLVRITASIGGAEIQEGEILTERGRSNSPRYQVRVTGRYFDGSVVPVASVDTGTETNLPPGTVLEWYSPPAGVGPRAVVVDQDGEGLTGGRSAPSPEDHKAAILDKLRDPPGAENDAHYRSEARRAGVPVQQAFCYPAVLGAGTIGMALTLFPARKGGSRVPTEQQVRAVAQHLQNAFGADDSILVAMTAEQPVTVAIKVAWAKGAAQWANSSPWPTYAAASGDGVFVSAVTSALMFELATGSGDYTTITQPSAGKRLALYDASASRFVEKRIASVTGTGPWAITVDTTNRASDENYTPVVGQRVSPWSDSLADVADAIVGVFDGLGAGEMVATTALDSPRRRRTPVSPAYWPTVLTQDALESAVSPNKLASVADRELVEGDGITTNTGTPGTLVYVLKLGDLAVFQKP